MIAVLKQNASQAQIEQLVAWLKAQELDVHVSHGQDHTVLGLIGDTGSLDTELLGSLDIVESVRRVSEPFEQCARRVHPEDTVVSVGNVRIGGGNFCLIAGPCSVETEAQIIEVAQKVKAAGADILRGGAFKPRTSPYDFQGLGADGIALLLEAKKATGLPIVTRTISICLPT